MQLQGEYTMVSSRLPSLVMMRGGVADADPFLVSRNTLGKGKTTTQSLKDKCQMVVAESGGGFALGNAEVVVVVDEEAIVPK